MFPRELRDIILTAQHELHHSKFPLILSVLFEKCYTCVCAHQICVPQLLLVGGRSSRRCSPKQDAFPPRLTCPWSAVDEADCIFRHSQAHQQPAGWQRTCKLMSLYTYFGWSKKNNMKWVILLSCCVFFSSSLPDDIELYASLPAALPCGVRRSSS